MSECSHSCSDCDKNCNERTEAQSFAAAPNQMSHVKKVIGVVSGKGGVGKSLVTSLLASGMQKAGYRTAILDADITGPSIPRVFGLQGKAQGSEYGILPMASKAGVSIMSINLLLENDTDPVIWRGPVIAGTVKQFWSDVVWDEIDYMFVDMPPGTGDVPLTVFQSLPVDGIVVVTSPQELVSMIVGKAVKMAQMMNIPILGVVENMSYVQCGTCGEKISLFGQSHLSETAREYGLEVLGQLPIDPAIATACDQGHIEDLDASPWLEKAFAVLKAKYSTDKNA